MVNGRDHSAPDGFQDYGDVAENETASTTRIDAETLLHVAVRGGLKIDPAVCITCPDIGSAVRPGA